MEPRPLPDVEPPGPDRDALERVRRRGRIIRRRHAAIGTAVVAVVVLGIAGALALDHRPETDDVRVTSRGDNIPSTAPTLPAPAPSVDSRTVPTDASPPSAPTTTALQPTATSSGVDLATVKWDRVDYPIDCGDRTGTKKLDMVLTSPEAGRRLAVVMAACDAGAGTPGRWIFVYDRADSPTTPHLSQVLTSDDDVHVTGTLSATGRTVTTTGSTYSSSNVPRCCPDGTFTAHWRWNGSSYVPG